MHAQKVDFDSPIRRSYIVLHGEKEKKEQEKPVNTQIKALKDPDLWMLVNS